MLSGAQCHLETLKSPVEHSEVGKTVKAQSNKKPANYVERISQDYVQNSKRIEMIHKKNLKRQEALKRAKTELIQNTSKAEVTQPKIIVDSKTAPSEPSPIMLNALFKSKQRLKKKYKKESDQLLSIYEQTGEDTASVESQLDEDDSDVINLGPRRKISSNANIIEDPAKRLESIDKLEYKYPKSTKQNASRKNTLDELHDFVNNLMNFGSNRDIEITVEKDINENNKTNEDNVFDIEYYGVNKTNNSL